MKTKLFSLLVVTAGLLALGAQAQVATPSTPAPAIDVVSTPPANQIVYAPRLPSTTELTNVAAAQGLSIDKIIQTVSQMTVVYRSANGQTNTVAYMLLPVAGSTAANQVPAPSAAPGGAIMGTTTQTVIAVPSPAPQVVYATPAPAPVYYYDPFYYPAYYGYPWYSPVSVSIGWGFGYYGGHYHGGGDYHGGYHGGHH